MISAFTLRQYRRFIRTPLLLVYRFTVDYSFSLCFLIPTYFTPRLSAVLLVGDNKLTLLYKCHSSEAPLMLSGAPTRSLRMLKEMTYAQHQFAPDWQQNHFGIISFLFIASRRKECAQEGRIIHEQFTTSRHISLAMPHTRYVAVTFTSRN